MYAPSVAFQLLEVRTGEKCQSHPLQQKIRAISYRAKFRDRPRCNVSPLSQLPRRIEVEDGWLARSDSSSSYSTAAVLITAVLCQC